LNLNASTSPRDGQPGDPPVTTSTVSRQLVQLPPTLSAPPLRATHRVRSGPLSYIDVFVDDFIALCQGSKHRLSTVRRILLHTVDDFLKSPDEHPKAKEPLSLKKLSNGDASWDTVKTILGWLIDSVCQTLSLPDHRSARTISLIEEFLSRKRCTLRQWQKLLGELRFVSPGVPGSRGLFAILQLPLQRQTTHRVRITRHLHSHLLCYLKLVQGLSTRATGLGEIVPDTPCVIGATDASGLGFGGVFFSTTTGPIVWRSPISDSIRERLVTHSNPNGDITNSDLEQFAALAHLDVITSLLDVREQTIGTLTDNTPTLSRMFKGATTTSGAAAYLCQRASEHQRHHRYCSEFSFIPGEANVMPDAASRLFHLTDSEFLTHFNTHFPQTQGRWRLCHLPRATRSSLTSALLRQPASNQWLSPLASDKPHSGPIGTLSARSRPSTAISLGSKGPTSTSKSSSCGSAGGISTTATNLLELGLWLNTSVPSARKSSGWWTRPSAPLP
jgi:hypothetical protein